MEETEGRDTNPHSNVGTSCHCDAWWFGGLWFDTLDSAAGEAVPKKIFLKSSSQEIPPQKKNLIQENRRDLYGFAARRKDSGFNSVVKKQQSHHFAHNCPAARVCFMCRFTVRCRYKADARLCVWRAGASAAAWTLRPGSLQPFCEVRPFASKAEVELFFTAILEAKSCVSHVYVNDKVSNYSV